MTIASAPGKVIISGEHSVVYGKPAIAGAINLRCKVRVKDADSGLTILANDLDKILRYDITQLKKLKQNKTEINQGFDNLAVAAMTAISPDEMAYEISINSDIPIGAGLGSSAATSVAIVGAVMAHNDEEISQEKISALAFEAEKIAHGTPSGIDNTVASLGGLVQFTNGKIEQIELDEEIPLMIINSKVPRNTKQLVTKVRERRERFPNLMDRILDEMGKISLTIKEGLIAKNYREVGELFDINQGLLSSIGVNHYKIEELISKVRETGALGAKLTGAGGGGCMIALLPKRQNDMKEELLNIAGVEIYQTTLTKRGVEINE